MDPNKINTDSYEELKRLKDRIDRKSDPELYSQIVKLLYERRAEENTAHIQVKQVHTKPNVMGRTIAFFIDYAMVIGTASFITSLFPVMAKQGYLTSRGIPALSIFLFWFIYLVFIEYKYGATFGNRIVGLEPKSIISEDRKLTLGQSFKRHLVDILDAAGFALLLIYNTPWNQRMGDRLAKTIVIDIEDINQGFFDKKN